MNTFCFYLKNIFKNFLMLLLPELAVRLRKPTGTGDTLLDNNPSALIDYGQSVFEKYLHFLEVDDACAFLRGKTIIELGPGDTLTVALLFLAFGAEKIICIDRFPLVRSRKKNALLVKMLMEKLPDKQCRYLQQIVSFHGADMVTWNKNNLVYFCNKEGSFSGVKEKADLLVSNAVLEHIPDLDRSFYEMRRIMKKGAFMVHAVDLGPHQLSHNNPLDFLLIPEWLWRLMTSHRGAPNRARKSSYERLLKNHCFDLINILVTERFDQLDIIAAQKKSPHILNALSDEDLSARSILFSAQKR